MKIFFVNIVAIIIGIVASVFSIIEFIYSYKLSVSDIFVSVEKLHAIYGDSIKIVISLTNESLNGLEIVGLKLFKNDTEIKDNGYDYGREKYNSMKRPETFIESINSKFQMGIEGDEEYEKRSPSKNFSGIYLLSKVGHPTHFSYWINKDEIPDTLEITANKRLRLFSRKKQYHIH